MFRNKEKRSSSDRRKEDMGPPDKSAERRLNPERRLPEVVEISVEEFMRLLAENKPGLDRHAEESKDAAFQWDTL